MRFGTHADQKYFWENGFDNLYDNIAINANMIAFSPEALAAFIVKKTPRKSFFIDPITHAFQHDQSFICDVSGENRIKKSIGNLIEEYGKDLKDIISEEKVGENNKTRLYAKKKLVPEDFTKLFIESFSKKVISFQKNIILKKKAESYIDYITFAKKEDPKLDFVPHLNPKFLVAPYFYLDDIGWLDVNIRLIDESKRDGNEIVYAQIVLSKKWIERAIAGGYANSELAKNIINRYKTSNADGFLVWIDNYSEHEERPSVGYRRRFCNPQ